MNGVLRDYSILLKPVRTPLNGIEFSHRYPCGETEKIKYIVRTFLYIRKLSLHTTGAMEDQFPLKNYENLVKENDSLDLSIKNFIVLFSKNAYITGVG